MTEEKVTTAGFRKLPLLCASLTLLVSLLTFAGWISGMPLLASVRAKYIPMAASTALCFSLLGVGLILQLHRPALRWIPRLLTTVVLLIACAKSVEVIAGVRFGIDAWFVRNPGMFGAVPTGRMAPMTALNFVFTSLGVLVLTWNKPGKWAGACGAIATMISAIVLVDTTMFATCFYVVADVQRAELRFASAGHPNALHLRNGEAAAELLHGNGLRGPAMGIFPTARYATATRSMAKGDLVMLFTDGLFEVEDASGALFTQEQLHATVSRHAALVPEEFFTRVVEDIRRFTQRETFADDVCVVGVQVQHVE